MSSTLVSSVSLKIFARLYAFGKSLRQGRKRNPILRARPNPAPTLIHSKSRSARPAPIPPPNVAPYRPQPAPPRLAQLGPATFVTQQNGSRRAGTYARRALAQSLARARARSAQAIPRGSPNPVFCGRISCRFHCFCGPSRNPLRLPPRGFQLRSRSLAAC